MTSSLRNQQIQNAVTSKLQKPEPYYSYTPLPTGWIRLLKIQDIPEQVELDASDMQRQIHVSMHAFSFSECPEYTALSYTWGEPRVTIDPTYRIFTQEPRCFPIICEGRILRGTRNLSVALRQLRLSQYNSKRRPHNGVQEDDTREYYWIDGLCIDQDDLSERTTQVALMGNIYSQAAVCTIWLGEADEYSDTALQVVTNLRNNPMLRDLAYSVNMGLWTKMREIIRTEIEKLSDQEVVAVIALMSRTWFARVWILQEAVLPKSLIGRLGFSSFNFEDLVLLGTVLGLGHSYQLLTMRPRVLDMAKSQHPEVLRSFSRAVVTLTMLHRVRAQFKQNSMPDITEVIRMSYPSKATDPRDRIYGILAITKEFGTQKQPTIQADYTLPLSTVYSKATSVILSRHNDLKFLSMVQDSALSGIENLPSWCPDFSFMPSSLVDIKYSINKSLWNFQPRIEILNEKLLLVDGFLFDAVSRVQLTWDCRFGSCNVRGAELVLGLLRMALSLKWKSQKRSIQKATPTRVESLWRMLFRDEVNGEFPAPAAVGLYFPWMLWQIFANYKIDSIVSQRPLDSPLTLTIEKVIADLKALHQVVVQLCRIEPQSRAFLPDAETIMHHFRENISKVDHMSSEAIQNALVYAILFTPTLRRQCQEAGLEQEFDKLLRLNSSVVISDEQWLNQTATLFNTTISTDLLNRIGEKAFFTTRRTELLGSGQLSIMEGDEVWILQGANTPVILRPLKNGSYQFCAYAFIYGIQDEDLLDERWKEGAMKRITIE